LTTVAVADLVRELLIVTHEQIVSRKRCDVDADQRRSEQ